MTDEAAGAPSGANLGKSSAPVIYGVTVFASAALIFLVEPMIAKMVLPTLGGSAMVWNICMAFFQFSLLIGYLYAHLLQRIPSLKTQVLVHAVVLLVAAAVLPLRVNQLMGPDPGDMNPALWLVGVLALSLGPPFAALSATAPLAQAWYARVRSGESDAVNPYVLYVASNLGSLIALLAYPTLVEPLLTLGTQRIAWTIGYGLFFLAMLAAAYSAARFGAATPLSKVVEQEELTKTVTWKDRLLWMALAAAPSSLMLGTTTHITMDVASTPFLWVAPLALYLLTFIFAFSNRPPISPFFIGILQAAAVILVAISMSFQFGLFSSVFIQFAGFFLTALLCHTVLAERRPHPSRLTEFYLLMALGGVLGGAFNAFVAPLVFLQGVWEFPIVLVLACLARPWGPDDFKRWEWVAILIGTFFYLAILSLAIFVRDLPPWLYLLYRDGINLGPWATWIGVIGPLNFGLVKILMVPAVVCTFLVRDRGLIFAVLIAALIVAPELANGRQNIVMQDRSFFGVLRVTQQEIYGYARVAHALANGTTLHGAQARDPDKACIPLTYYAPATPIGQVFNTRQATKPAVSIGAVGMGAGTVASFVRPTDNLRFFEIDKHVIHLATNPANFTYIKGCAKGPIDWKLGDARVFLEKEPSDKFDILLVDAFSSDAVPAHLLTVEAMRTYLRVIKPDGVVIMHLSNRHLSLAPAVAAVAKAAGGSGLYQYHYPQMGVPEFTDTGEEAIIVGRNAAALADFAGQGLWTPSDPEICGAKPWTDDYSNLFGALVRGTAAQRGMMGALAKGALGKEARACYKD